MTSHDRITAILDGMGLPAFVRRWNANSGGAKIATYDGLMKAMSYDKRLDDAFDEARLRETDDCRDTFERNVELSIGPLISSTFLLAVLRVSDDFARGVVDMAPAQFELTEPFSTVDEWIAWVLRTVEHPLDFCGPMGEDVLEDDAIEAVLGRSLRAVLPDAVEAGWVSARNCARGEHVQSGSGTACH